jgi:hypothetical protein
MFSCTKSVLVVLSLAAAVACAQAPEVQTLYDISADGSSPTVKAGQAGKLVLSIQTKAGAHVSDEAPLKIELSSKEAKLDKSKLTLSDSVTKKKAGSNEYPNPRFTPTVQGKMSIEAKMTFFICTDKVCARQTKTLNVPVEVN